VGKTLHFYILVLLLALTWGSAASCAPPDGDTDRPPGRTPQELVRELRVRYLLRLSHAPFSWRPERIESLEEKIRGKGPSAVPSLIDALRHQRPQYRSYRASVLKLLGEIGGTAVVDPLISELRSAQNGFVQASESLVQVGEPAVEPLLVLLRDENPAVASQAATALGAIGDVRAVEPLLDSLSREQLWAIAPLGELGDKRAVEPLYKRFQDEKRSAHHRFLIARPLAKLGDSRVFDFLVEHLQAATNRQGEIIPSDPLNHELIVFSLGDLRDARAAAPLVDALRAHNVRPEFGEPNGGGGGGGGGGTLGPDLFPQFVAEAFGKIFQESIAPIVPYLGDDNALVRAAIAQALGASQDNGAADHLVRLLSDSNSRVKQNAFRALCKSGRALEPVIQSLNDPDVCQSMSAGRRLSSYGKSAVEPLLRALEKAEPIAADRITKALGELRDPRAIVPLVEHIRNTESNWTSHGNAIEAIGEIGDPVGIEPLLEVLKDESAREELRRWTRMNVAEALGTIADPRGTDSLITLTRDENRYVRSTAAVGLGNIGDKKSSSALHPLLNDDDRQVREQAVLALGKIGDFRSVRPLLEVASSRLPGEQWEALTAIRRIGDSAFHPLLEALQSERPPIRVNAALALALFRDRGAVDPLLSTLQDEEASVRVAAARALGEIGDPKPIPALISMFASPRHAGSGAATAALWQIGSPAVEPLLAKLDDEQETVRAAAVRALVGIEDPRGLEAVTQLLKRETSPSVRWTINYALYRNENGPPSKQE